LRRLDKSQSKVSKEVAKVERSIKKAEKEVEGKENNLVPIDEKIDYQPRYREGWQKDEGVTKERDDQNARVSRRPRSSYPLFRRLRSNSRVNGRRR
jgi:structural maintenance of chromosome 1